MQRERSTMLDSSSSSQEQSDLQNKRIQFQAFLQIPQRMFFDFKKGKLNMPPRNARKHGYLDSPLQGIHGGVPSKKKETFCKDLTISSENLGCYCIKYSPNYESFAVSYGSGLVELRYPEGEIIAVLKSPSQEVASPITALRFPPDEFSYLLASCMNGKIYVCDISNKYNYVFTDGK